MIRHIVAWNFKDEISKEERKASGERIKNELESLVGKIPGLLEMKVSLKPLSSSGSEVMLDSVLESEAALAGYQVHEEHKKVASFIGSVMKDRKCLDFMII